MELVTTPSVGFIYLFIYYFNLFHTLFAESSGAKFRIREASIPHLIPHHIIPNSFPPLLPLVHCPVASEDTITDDSTMTSSIEQRHLASLMDVQIAAGTYDVGFYAQWQTEQEEWGACDWSAEQLEFWSEPARRKLVEENPEDWEEEWDVDVHGEMPSDETDLSDIGFNWGDCESEYEEVDVTFECDLGGKVELPANMSLDELSGAAGGEKGRRVYHLVQHGRARRFPMTNFDFKSTVLFGSMRTPRATNNPGLTTTATTADAGCILSQLNAQGPHFASKTKRLIADFCGVPYKAAFVEWVAQLECQVNTEAKGKEGNEDVKDEGETVGDDGDRSSSSQQQQQQQQQEDVSWDGPQYTVHTGWKCNSASEAIVVERACSVREFIYMLADTHPGYESCRCKFQERELVNGLRGVNGI